MKILGRKAEISQWFSKYSENFYCNNPEIDQNIKLKHDHSLRVAKNALEIAESLNLNENDCELAYLCGLLHDIGRFRQYKIYKSFVDTETIYHGDIGVDVLNSTPIPNLNNEEELEIIKIAVKNHGLIKINQGLSERELLFSKITRDADKLDIFQIVCDYYLQTESRNAALELGLDINKGISEKVLNDFTNKKVIQKADMQSLDDFRVLQLSWIFDIYFDFTRKQIFANKFTDIIVESIKSRENLEIIKNIIESELNLKQ